MGSLASPGGTRLLRAVFRKNVVSMLLSSVFPSNLLIKFFQIFFGEPVVVQEFTNLVVDKSLGPVSVLEFELVDEHALQLFSLLDSLQFLSSSSTHS